MAITQEVNLDIVEKLADGNLKIKYPKTKVSQVVGLDIATTSEAQTGTSNTKYMTPLRVKEVVDSKIVTGVYTGSGTIDRLITLGFKPKAVFIFKSGSVTQYYNSDLYGGLALDGYPIMGHSNNATAIGATIVTTGFTVSTGITGTGDDISSVNNSGSLYHYMAFK